MAKKASSSPKKGWTKVPDMAGLIEWEKGQAIEGKLIDVITAKSKKKGVKDKDQKKYKIFKIETADGVQGCGGTQLEQKMSAVKVGQEVRIEFKGKVKTSSGFKVNTFDVFYR